MNVLFLAPQPFYEERGTPIAVDMILKVLSERGDTFIDLVVYHLGREKAYQNVQVHRTLKIPLIRSIPAGFSFRKVICDLFLTFMVLRLVLRKRYHLVHAVEESVFIALLLKSVFGIPYIYDMDSSLSQQMLDRYPILCRPFSRLFFALEGLAVRNAKAVLPVCDALRLEIEKHKPGKVMVLWDVSLIENADEQSPENLHELVGADNLILIYVGNLEIYQGIDLLLESFSLAMAENGVVSLVIIGGKEADIRKYRARSRRLGIDRKVFFLGPKPVKHLSTYLAQADILVSPRIQGMNTPMKIFSYLGSGKPILATDLPTHTQVLDGRVAFLARPEPAVFANGMLRLVNDTKLRRQLGMAGRRLVEERHTFQIFRQKVNALYEWLKADIERGWETTSRSIARSPQAVTQFEVQPTELRIYYQPIISLETGKITGFEALVRWQHPEYGLLSPSEFINAAEETGQIIPIGQWVLHEACRQMQEWNLQFPSVMPLNICVNLSPKQLAQPELIEQIDRVLEETGLDTQSLTLEVPDQALWQDGELVSNTVLQLRARGVQVHLDYVNASAPSLNTLRRLPVSSLKIDRSFVSNLNSGEDNLEIIRKAIEVALESGIDVIAVGVETEDQLEQLKTLKCDFGQGFLFSQPLEEEEVETLIASTPRWEV